MALAIAEPKLRGPSKATEQRHARSSVQAPRAAQTDVMMLVWSPWIAMLRQQALLARDVIGIISARQQEFAQLWRLPSRQAAQADDR
jgi:hypothetical protein